MSLFDELSNAVQAQRIQQQQFIGIMITQQSEIENLQTELACESDTISAITAAMEVHHTALHEFTEATFGIDATNIAKANNHMRLAENMLTNVCESYQTVVQQHDVLKALIPNYTDVAEFEIYNDPEELRTKVIMYLRIAKQSLQAVANRGLKATDRLNQTTLDLYSAIER
jgi:hypothetical protein